MIPPELYNLIERPLDELTYYLDLASRGRVPYAFARARGRFNDPGLWRELAQALREAAVVADRLADLTTPEARESE